MNWRYLPLIGSRKREFYYIKVFNMRIFLVNLVYEDQYFNDFIYLIDASFKM